MRNVQLCKYSRRHWATEGARRRSQAGSAMSSHNKDFFLHLEVQKNLNSLVKTIHFFLVSRNLLIFLTHFPPVPPKAWSMYGLPWYGIGKLGTKLVLIVQLQQEPFLSKKKNGSTTDKKVGIHEKWLSYYLNHNRVSVIFKQYCCVYN